MRRCPPHCAGHPSAAGARGNSHATHAAPCRHSRYSIQRYTWSVILFSLEFDAFEFDLVNVGVPTLIVVDDVLPHVVFTLPFDQTVEGDHDEDLTDGSVVSPLGHR